MARRARHVEILDLALGLGRELLEEPSCPAEELQESPHPGTSSTWALLERLDRRALIAVDLEQTIEVRGAEDLLNDRRHLAEPQLAARLVDPALQQDQLAEESARDQADVGKIDHQSNRAAVVGQGRGDLVAGLANGSFVEELMVLKPDDLDSVRVVTWILGVTAIAY